MENSVMYLISSKSLRHYIVFGICNTQCLCSCMDDHETLLLARLQKLEPLAVTLLLTAG
jgi:hypothetical protein